METLTIERESFDAFAEMLRASAEMFGELAKKKNAEGNPAAVLSGEYYRGCAAGFGTAMSLLAGYAKEWEKAQED